MLDKVNTLTMDMFTQGMPARLDSTRTAKVLGFQEHDVPVLVNRGLLQPLGKPAQNARKYFAAVEILALAGDPAWLNKATRILYHHWQEKNANRSSDESEAQPIAA